MKFPSVILSVVFAVVAFTGAAQAQDQAPSEGGERMVRVFIEAPYHYDMIVRPDSTSGETFTLYVEGKEVGEAAGVLNCTTREWTLTVTQDFTGSSELFIIPTLSMYCDQVCGR